MRKQAVVIHSGGMDSSLCLALALRRFGSDAVTSLSFSYGQRHATELEAARTIAKAWRVENVVVDLHALGQVTSNALMDTSQAITDSDGAPTTLVVGRNGLMAQLGAAYAQTVGARIIYMGVMELEEANSGYRDCSRHYMDLKQELLRIDLDDPAFEIATPLVTMTKVDTMALADQLGLLDFLIEHTVSCYHGLKGRGCGTCPACTLRNEGIDTYGPSRLN